jgi:HEAT repeat protein
LAADATTALLAIRDGAAEQFRATLPKSAGKTRVGIVQALGVLKDAESAAPLREAVNSSQRDEREAAAWALASIGDAGSADLLLKVADAAEGFGRTAATNACLLLAENLSAAGKKAEARKIYSHLWERPSDVPEDHVKQAAQTGIRTAN